MIRRLTLAALLSSFPTALPAQSVAPLIERNTAPICDTAEVRRLERRRQVGGRLALGTLAANAIVLGLSVGGTNPEGAPRAIERGRRSMGFAVATLPIVLLGAYFHATSYPDDGFWARALARTKVGETTSADVVACLRKPTATSISGAEEKWTYLTTPSDDWWSRGSLRTVSFTFRNGVLAEVRRAEVNLPQAWTTDADRVPVVVPVP
jgi:hypothetical protein